eukprot:1134181_1
MLSNVAIADENFLHKKGLPPELIIQPWKLLEVVWNGALRTLHAKFCFSANYCGFIVTDNVNVWSYITTEDDIVEQSKPLRNNTVSQSIELLKHLLLRTDKSDHRNEINCVDSGSISSITMNSSMKIGNYNFKWSFELSFLGSREEQALFIRDQIIFPFMAITRELILPTVTNDERDESIR